jgi:hypothetical protein
MSRKNFILIFFEYPPSKSWARHCPARASPDRPLPRHDDAPCVSCLLSLLRAQTTPMKVLYGWKRIEGGRRRCSHV